jgi:hypothetical protein
MGEYDFLYLLVSVNCYNFLENKLTLLIKSLKKCMCFDPIILFCGIYCRGIKTYAQTYIPEVFVAVSFIMKKNWEPPVCLIISII